MNVHRTQLQRVRDRLLAAGYISRDQCLSQFPAITRLGARICDLEADGFVFDAKKQGGDYVYRLISINGEPYRKPGVTTDEDVRIAQSAVKMFDNYHPAT